MDLLAKRYASPFLILDDFIRLQQVCEFVVETLTMIAEERIRDQRWEYWLHRVFDMSFEEYLRLCDEPKHSKETINHKEIGSIISDSKMLVNGLSIEQ